MPRIYSNYTTDEYTLLQNKAMEVGLSSLSAYQKYVTLLGITSYNNYNLVNLIKKMMATLKGLKSGTTFIVSSLLPEEWVTLNRSQKNTLAQQLKKFIDENKNEYERVQVLSSKTTQYKKL